MMEKFVINSGSAMPDEMAMIFLAWPLRMSGRARLNRWMFPRVLILKDSSMSSSSLSGSSPLNCKQLRCTEHGSELTERRWGYGQTTRIEGQRWR